MMEYQGYVGRITSVDEKNGAFHGEIADINDVVTFAAKSAKELAQAFRDSVDDYLAFCDEEEEEAEKPFSGKFLVRISPGLHKKATQAAKRANASLNAWVAAAIREFLGSSSAAPDSNSKRTKVPSRQPG